MGIRILVGVAFVVFALSLAGCWETSTTSEYVDADPVVFHAPLLEAARTYESFGRIDSDQLRWAPVYCRDVGNMDQPIQPQFSHSGDAETHGRKLYSLFVKTLPSGYVRGGNYAGNSNPVGQVIVKESWIPELVSDTKAKREPVVKKVQRVRNEEDGTRQTFEDEDRFLPYAEKDGKWYHAAARGPLFIMMKVTPGTPGTDRGWVYGVVSADGKQVQEAGRIDSCMNCHVKAPHDRLFGPPKE